MLPPPPLPVDPAVLRTFDSVVDVCDPNEIDIRSRVSLRLLKESQACRYVLRDRSLPRAKFDAPIMTIADRRLGSILIALCGDRFATEGYVGGDGIDSYCFSMMLQGKAVWIRGRTETEVVCADGAAVRLGPGTRMISGANNARRNLFLDVDAVERRLEAMLDDKLRKPLEFAPGVDWSRGLGASLRYQLDLLIQEMPRRDGVADNPVALASFTDLILSLVLRGFSHNYLDRLEAPQAVALPAYVRRAEDFMHANAAVPIRMEEVADAAGCSVRNLESVFRRFRGATPLAILHRIRLDRVQAELRHGLSGRSLVEVAQRHGFSNQGRFAAAYRRRFGEAPLETARQRSGPIVMRGPALV